MVEPWMAVGAECVTVDLQPAQQGGAANYCWPRVHHLADILTWELPPASIVFAFPPCTDLAVSGARWYRDKGMRALIGALTLVERCRELCEESGAPYMIENPVGQLSTYWRPPDFIFDPCEFAGYADDPDSEAYTKRTCLWVGGGFQLPRKRPVEPTLGSLFHRTAPGPERANIRSRTPQGFARAVFEANRHILEKAA
jgi:hypothetical protein